MKRFDHLIVDLLAEVTGYDPEEIAPTLELPPRIDQGDRAVPCFRWSKKEKVSPKALAERWTAKIATRKLPKEIDRVEAIGGYLNFFLNRTQLTAAVLKEIHDQGTSYGFVKNDAPGSAVIEFSSPNIAKPFSIGHLRSTNIGAALSRIFEARGWRVIRLNHLGDWGTQFGKLISAYRRWGSAEFLGDKPIENLYKLYVRFHEEEVTDPTLIHEAREWFARLEKGDEEAKELWQWFRDLTIRELKQLYGKLNVEFDYYWGESFYIDRIPPIVKRLEDEKISSESDDAVIVNLEKHDLSVCVIKKSDESTLYLTRDLAAAIYRKEHFNFHRMLYVVGAPQRLHFQQLFKILELLGNEWVKDCEHIPFGHISFGDESMSTRKGNIVFLADVMTRAVELARKIVEEKNPELENKEAVADQVGIGAVLFADLSAKRIKDVKFSWEDILSFDGETGPYLQYSLVRTKSLIRRYEKEIQSNIQAQYLSSPEEQTVVRSLALFPTVLERAEKEREPFLMARYAVELAQDFNRFYTKHRILDADTEEKSTARMALVSAVSNVLDQALTLLGIPRPEKM